MNPIFCSGCLSHHEGLKDVPRGWSTQAVQSSWIVGDSSSDLCHVLFCTALGVGHFTPISNTISALFNGSKYRNLRITFFSPIRAWEVNSCQAPAVSSEYVRCVRVPLSGEDVHPITMNAMLTRREELQKKLAEVLEENQAWPPVSVVVHDFFAIYAFEYADKVLRVPRVIFNSSHSLCFLWLADLELNSRIMRGERKMQVSGFKQPVDIQLFWHMMSLGPPEPVFLEYNVKRIARTALGMITTDAPALYPNLLDEIRETIARDRQFRRFFGNFTMYHVGPTCIFHHRSEALRQESGDIQMWLESQDKLSVILIALGTLYPIPLDALAALMQGLEKFKRPFIWAYNTRGEKRQEAIDMVVDFRGRCSGFGRVVDWVDQRLVLNHPSLRLFITHGGWNSLVEVMTFAGVPLICVPLGSEQPINATIVKSAFEMGQVAMVEDADWIKPEYSEEEIEKVIATMIQDSTQMMKQMLPYQRCKFRFLNGEEWFEMLTEVAETNFSKYHFNAKDTQTRILKSTLPHAKQDQMFDEIASHFNSLKGLNPPDSGDMSPL